MEISGNLEPGKMDRELVFSQQTVVSDDVGQAKVTWTTFAAVWGEEVPMGPSERFKAAGLHSVMTSTFKIYYLEGLLPTMRLTGYKGFDWQIIGISEMGRRDGMMVTAEVIQ